MTTTAQKLNAEIDAAETVIRKLEADKSELAECLGKVTRRLEHMLTKSGIGAMPSDIREARALLQRIE